MTLLKERLVVYGNCQGFWLADVLGQDPAITDRFDVVYLPSFGEPPPDHPIHRPDFLAGCSHAIWQTAYGAPRPDFLSALPAGCRQIRYPIVFLKLLWPTYVLDPRNTPEPGFPFGRFPYGDRLVLELLDAGVSLEDLPKRYMDTDLNTVVNLERFRELALAELRLNDRECDFGVAPFVERTFRHRKLFGTVNHPTILMLSRLLDGVKGALLGHAVPAEAPPLANGDDVVGWEQVPLHPQIIEHYGLTWVSPETKWPYRSAFLSLGEYVRAYAAFEPITYPPWEPVASFPVRAKRPPPPAGAPGLRIAVVNPLENTAETQCVAWMRLAAERLGHTLDTCRTSDELAALAPDFALVFNPGVPKLTDVPTYGLILDFRKHWLSDPGRLANLYSYDGYFALTDRLHGFVRDALWAARRDEPVGRFYPSALGEDRPPLAPETFARARLAYFGTNWDPGRRSVLARLAAAPWLDVYGPTAGWTFLEGPAYKGSVPFDGHSVPERYRAAGLGLVLLTDSHLADDCTTNRIFEICAAGALALVPRMPWYERVFGDSVLYFAPQAGENFVAEEIATRVEWAIAHPDQAAAMAARAHAIFRREFALERLFPNVVRYHEEREAARAARPPSPHAKVSVVVRTSERGAHALRRCLRSVAAQAGVEVDVVLVTHRWLEPESLLEEFRGEGLAVSVVDGRGGPASRRLWAGLAHCTGPFVAVLDDGDEWLPDHLGSLLEAARAEGKGFAYSGTIWHHPSPEASGWGRREYRSIRSFSMGVLPSLPLERAAMLPIGSYLFRRDLLEARDLVDPEMDTAGDWALTLILLQKEHPAFTFRATAVCRPAREPETAAMAAARHEDAQRLRLRFLSRPFPPPPAVLGPDQLLSDPGDPGADSTLPSMTGTTSEYGIPPQHVLVAGSPVVWDTANVELGPADVDAVGETRSESADATLPLRVRPPRQAWSYGARLSLPYPTAGPCVVQLRCRVLKGRAGFGVLTRDETAFIERQFVSVQPNDVLLNLPIPLAEEAGRVVVQTADHPEGAEVLIERVELAVPRRA